MQNEFFSPMEIDTIGEIMNISLGSSATAISTMLDKTVNITTPKVEVKNSKDMEFAYLEPAVGVEINYTEGLSGSNIMILKRTDIKAIVETLMQMSIPDEEFELDEMNISAVCEVMNQMMGASTTALSEFLAKTINISTPRAFEIDNSSMFKDTFFEKDEMIVNIKFHLTIEDIVESEFICVFTLDLAKDIVASLGIVIPEEESQPEPIVEEIPEVVAQVDMPQEPSNPITYEQPVAMPQEHINVQVQNKHSNIVTDNPINVQPIIHRKFEEPKTVLNGEQKSNLDLIMSVPLEVTVEIGRTKRRVKDILEFTKGTLIELDKLAGENVDVFVNGQCIAKGDVVVIDDCFGVRITEVLKNLEI